MIGPTDVEPRDGLRIWVRYSDGVSGEVDLSHLRGVGIFQKWEDRAFFETARIGLGRSIVWDDEIDLCPDALYMEITGLPVDEALELLYGPQRVEERPDADTSIRPLVRVQPTVNTAANIIDDGGVAETVKIPAPLVRVQQTMGSSLIISDSRDIAA